MTDKNEMLAVIFREGAKSLVSHYQIFHKTDGYLPAAPFHYKISDILLRGKRNFAVEAFRQSGKTSLIMMDFPTYLLQYARPEISYVIFVKQNQDLAEDKLRQATGAYLANPLLKVNLLKVIRNSGKVFEAEVMSPYTNNKMNIIFEAYGKGAAIRGLVYQNRRPDLVVIDDPQDFEDSRSETVLKRDWEWFMSDIKPLGRDTRLFIIGNNLGETCLIERIFAHADMLGFDTLKVPAIEDGVPAWPDQFSAEFLEKEKDTYRQANQIDIWFRERLCLAVSDESRDFKSTYFRYYEDVPPNIVVKVGVDPAISKKDTADYTGIVVAGIDNKNRIYILETIKKRIFPDEIIEIIFNLAKKYRNPEIGVENVQYQKMLILELRKQMVLRNQFFMLREVAPMGEKEARIRASMQARYANGSVFHKSYMGDLEDELLAFPTGKNDDLIDAESIAVRMCDYQNRQTNSLTYLPETNKIGVNNSDLDEVFSPRQRNIILPHY